jgi:hypothetical protein
MSPEVPAKDHTLAPDEPALHPGWDLLEYLISIGGDEISEIITGYGDDDGKTASDEIRRKLTFAFLGDRERECTVTYGNQTNPRSIWVWRLDRKSIDTLRDVMPAGIMRSDEPRPAWAEDLCVYRGGTLLLGTYTHERYAAIRLSDAVWARWEAHAAAARRAT